ncbi:hypothetical protein PIB30_033390 [Stylosanthes scabra]|uniref:Uncharacterized protein n=1 Tax=Stylosanthes scabra TaxID=79078 RepID=A0ABU6QDT6_9FABA|nr:hypothetical protein [Stylosanthes scabra]
MVETRNFYYEGGRELIRRLSSRTRRLLRINPKFGSSPANIVATPKQLVLPFWSYLCTPPRLLISVAAFSSLPQPSPEQGIDLKAEGNSKKTKRTAPKSNDIYLKLLVKCHHNCYHATCHQHCKRLRALIFFPSPNVILGLIFTATFASDWTNKEHNCSCEGDVATEAKKPAGSWSVPTDRFNGFMMVFTSAVLDSNSDRTGDRFMVKPVEPASPIRFSELWFETPHRHRPRRTFVVSV